MKLLMSTNNNNNNSLFLIKSDRKMAAHSASPHSMKSEPLKSTFSIRSILEQQDPEPVSENDLIENEEILDEIDEPELPIEEAVKKEEEESGNFVTKHSRPT